MKVLVGVKRVVDSAMNLRVKSDGSGIEDHNLKMSINPFDEIALEEAVRLKEQGIAEEIIAVSIGSEACRETLLHALALGADRAILVSHNNDNDSDHDNNPNHKQPFEPLHIAKIFKALAEQEKPDLIILGKQAIDNDCNQVGQMLAALLDWPQATFASKLTIKLNEKTAIVTREIDAGLETISVNLPAVITTDLRLNEPRYIALPNIMKAKQKPLDMLDLTALDLSCKSSAFKSHQKIMKLSPPKERQAGVMLNNFDELLDKLNIKEKMS